MFVFVLLVLLVACHAQTRTDARVGAGAAQTTPVSVGDSRLPPSAARYDTRSVAADAFIGRGGPACADAVRGAAKSRGLQAEPDARLAELASWVADHSSSGGQLPSAEQLDLAARQLGLVEPLPTVSVIATDAPSGMAVRVLDEASALYARRNYTHFGGVIREEAGGQRCIFVLSQRLARFTPMLRTIPVGATIELRGTLDAGYTTPTLAVTFPDGHVARSAPAQGAQIRLDEKTAAAGVYRIEVLAEGRLGTTVIANFPVYVGVPAPERLPSAPTGDGDGDPRIDPRQRTLDLLNEERRSAGVAPLTLDATLSQLALAHSQDMLAHDYIGHTSPTAGTAGDRVARAGVRTSLVLENIGRGYSLREVHEGLLASPGHRANIVHPQATNVGIGVVTEPEHDRTAYLVTEVFTRVTAALTSDAAQRVLELVNRARAARKLAPLQQDAELSPIAAAAARRYFAPTAPSDAQVMAETQQALERPSKKARRIAGLLTVVGGVDELAGLDALLAPSAHMLGIGLAQGTRADTFTNAICAVLLVSP